MLFVGPLTPSSVCETLPLVASYTGVNPISATLVNFSLAPVKSSSVQAVALVLTLLSYAFQPASFFAVFAFLETLNSSIESFVYS